ncbi:hypothetical protein GOP47_0028434 [Adiantum capillus-veneris]|nr:hypothetical protein GOP47_0028434 [Adiantum capillus-veneris]
MPPSTRTLCDSALRAVVDPPPTPWPFVPALALLALLSLGHPPCHPLPPCWGSSPPLDSYSPSHAPTYETTSSVIGEMGFTTEKDERALIIVVSKDEGLRPVFVLLNSTISNTKEPEKLHFVVILPSSIPESECLKLQAVLENVPVTIFRDGYIIEKMKSLLPAESASERNFKRLDVMPFYLPKMFPSFDRFVYLELDAVLQGDIEEIIQLEMESDPVAGVEDCSQQLETFFSMELLEAARVLSRNEKPALPAQPYEPKTCLFDKSTLVIDQKAWREENVTEAVQWWIAMYHRTAESLYSNGHLELPFQLALYKKCKQLDALWNVRRPLTYADANEAKLVHFDKEHKPWHQTKPTNFEKDITRIWWKYISPSANMVFLAH